VSALARREFLKQGAAALIIGVSSNASGWRLLAAMQSADEMRGARPAARSTSWDQLDSWLAIGTDGKVTVYTGRVDNGTGVRTSFAQVIADELDVTFENVAIVMGDTDLTPDQGKTTASNNSDRGQKPLVRAAAEARQILLKMAADQWKVPLERLTVRDGVIRTQDDAARKVSYGELLGGRRFKTKLNAKDPGDNWGPLLTGDAPLKSGNFRYVGQSLPRVDVAAKVTGTFPYVHNVRIPGMVHGRMVRPPTIGATLLNIDEYSVRNAPGLIKVVRKGNFLGVVAQREEQAIAAARQLKATWSESQQLPADEFEWMRSAKPIRTNTNNKGDFDAALARAAKVVKATYKLPVQNHAMIGPSCAVADVRDGEATFWSGSQWIQGNRRDLAQMLGLPAEKVHGIWVEGSGTYGRLICDDAAADAALLSQAVGKPVRVQWSREDEHIWEPKSPPTLVDMRAGLGSNGTIVAFSLEGWSPSHSTGEAGNFLAWRLLGTNPGHDRLSGGPSGHLYAFENDRRVVHYVPEIYRACTLRGPGDYQTDFAVESFMDELARVANADPVEFRMRHFKDADCITLLRTLAAKSGWRPHTSPRRAGSNARVATGRGICHGSPGKVTGAVVEVEVDRETSKVRVLKATIAATCGRVINPESMKHQLQGAFLQGVSRCLFEGVKSDRGQANSRDWRSYPILTFPEVPQVETVLIDQPGVDSTGVGEVGSVPTGAAIANAIFDATGARLREIPFTPARVKAALSQA
jgi:CO/xanthine dehydrogenase Mo-binding subunit